MSFSVQRGCRTKTQDGKALSRCMLGGRKNIESLTARNQYSILRVSHLFGSFELFHTKIHTMYTNQASSGCVEYRTRVLVRFV